MLNIGPSKYDEQDHLNSITLRTQHSIGKHALSRTLISISPGFASHTYIVTN